MKFSIITINYNNKIGLERTIKSVIAQTYKDYEYIIIDGASTDGSVEIIKEYGDYISYWISEPDDGLYYAMNKGTLVANGVYCNYLNSGDYYHDDMVLAHMAALPESDILTGCHDYGIGRNVGMYGITMLDLFKWSYNHQESFIRRELCLKYPYDVKYRLAADRKFFIEAFVVENCSSSFTDKLIIDVEPGGLSMQQHVKCLNEIDQLLHEFLLPRMYEDYKRFALVDSPLLDLTPFLNRTKGISNIVYKFALILIRLRISKWFCFLFRKSNIDVTYNITKNTMKLLK